MHARNYKLSTNPSSLLPVISLLKAPSKKQLKDSELTILC